MKNIRINYYPSLNIKDMQNLENEDDENIKIMNCDYNSSSGSYQVFDQKTNPMEGILARFHRSKTQLSIISSRSDEESKSDEDSRQSIFFSLNT